MTLAEYLQAHPQLHLARISERCVQVYSVDEKLWHLSDWLVSTRSCETVFMIRRMR